MPQLHVTAREFRGILAASMHRRFVPVLPPPVAYPLEVDDFEDFIEGLLLWFGVSHAEIGRCKFLWQTTRTPLHVVRHRQPEDLPAARLEW